MSKIELLAPAGGKAAAVAAVQSGADAVYIGGSRFNARQSADNFTIEEMKELVDYCHLYGVLVYVTVNTLIKEREIPELISYARELNKIGVDAVIVQDLGAVKLFKQATPKMCVHASTQMTVTDASGVRYLNQLGIERVVLARELSAEKIREISKTTDSELEIFVHGALCMCYSGQCLMSSVIGGRSGNRGRCAQPCRLSYTLIEDGKAIYDGFLLSPKDLNLSGMLDIVKNTGSVSLKIEGRLKRPEYVAAVVSVYRKYLDNYKKVSDEDRQVLLDAFNRGGFTTGFFGGQTGKAMMCHDNSGNAAENKFTKTAKEMSREDANFRKIFVHMYARLSENEPFTLTIWDENENYVTVSGEILAERATNKPLGKDRIENQLKKLGATPFEAREVTVDADEGLIVPVSEINNVRRKAVELLKEKNIKRETRPESEFLLHERKIKSSKIKLSAQVQTKEQAIAAKCAGIERIYVPKKVFYELKGEEFILRLPDIANESDTAENKLCIENISQLYRYKDRELYGGMHLNVYNSYAAAQLGLGCVTLSPELNVYEISDVCAATDAKTEIIAYGRLTLMLMGNCPVKACGKCAKAGKNYSLKDRKNEEFPILCGDNCVAQLINSKPIYMADKWDSIEKTGADFAKLVFTVESGPECEKIIDIYKNALAGEGAPKLPENTFTRGHFFRGVE